MSANDTQVGGEHYRREYQHWDLMAEMDAGYFPGQITKYTERHDRKNGREDLEKALHFAQKLDEIADGNPVHPSRISSLLERHSERVRNYAIAANLSALQERIFEYALLRPDQTKVLVQLCSLHMKQRYPEPKRPPQESVDAIESRYGLNRLGLRPSTPEDGGHHAKDSLEDDIASAMDQFSQEVAEEQR